MAMIFEIAPFIIKTNQYIFQRHKTFKTSSKQQNKVRVEGFV